MSKKIDILPGQSIWDLALQEGGSVEYVRELLLKNTDKLQNLNASPVAGDFLLADADPVDKEVKAIFDELYANLGIRPAELEAIGGEDGGDPPPSFGDFNNDFNSDFNT